MPTADGDETAVHITINDVMFFLLPAADEVWVSIASCLLLFILPAADDDETAVHIALNGFLFFLLPAADGAAVYHVPLGSGASLVQAGADSKRSPMTRIHQGETDGEGEGKGEEQEASPAGQKDL
ncbi:hypothetical protein [Aeromonas fluvialis]|uniref:hypothetical protein n=1 Tax=Aeromonas fluvialis TaxID=591962 RepID=UPI0012EE3632|nr:hypothetical protein [Aeromonas fluvialis]